MALQIKNVINGTITNSLKTEEFSEAKQIKLSGAILGIATSTGKNGWEITTTLASESNGQSSALVPGDYGQPEDSDSASAVTIPLITIDSHGLISKIENHTVNIIRNSTFTETEINNIIAGIGLGGYNTSTQTIKRGLITTTSNVKSSNGYTACPVINGVPYYERPTDVATVNFASTSVAGIVKIKENGGIKIEDRGTISVDEDKIYAIINDITTLPPINYDLLVQKVPKASRTNLGIVAVGDGLEIDESGVLRTALDINNTVSNEVENYFTSNPVITESGANVSVNVYPTYNIILREKEMEMLLHEYSIVEYDETVEHGFEAMGDCIIVQGKKFYARGKVLPIIPQTGMTGYNSDNERYPTSNHNGLILSQNIHTLCDSLDYLENMESIFGLKYFGHPNGYDENYDGSNYFSNDSYCWFYSNGFHTHDDKVSTTSSNGYTTNFYTYDIYSTITDRYYKEDYFNENSEARINAAKYGGYTSWAYGTYSAPEIGLGSANKVIFEFSDIYETSSDSSFGTFKPPKEWMPYGCAKCYISSIGTTSQSYASYYYKEISLQKVNSMELLIPFASKAEYNLAIGLTQAINTKFVVE